MADEETGGRMFRIEFVNHETGQVHHLTYAVPDAEAAVYNWQIDMEDRNLASAAEFLAVTTA
jgi:hypothetical protein